MFKRIVAAGALAGVLSGLLLTAIQQIKIAPLIRGSRR
jgi:predicted cobalt transporter CbtA